MFTERADDTSAADFEAWQRQEHLPSLLPGSAARLVVAADPLPLLMDAPGDVPRTEADDRRQMTLWFLDTEPASGVGRRHRRPPDGRRILGPGAHRGRPALHPHHPRDRYLHRHAVDRHEEVVVSSESDSAPTQRRFEGRTAIVTGASSGIGRATAVRLAAEGAAVACLDVVEEGLKETVESIVARGATAVAYRCDVTDEAGVIDTVDQVATALGRPSVLCNVAGIGAFSHTAEMPLDLWERILAVNLTGTFLMARTLVAPYARGQGRQHRQRGVERRADGRALVGGVLRFEGWRGAVHQGPGRRVRGPGCARQRRGPGGVSTHRSSPSSRCPQGATPKLLHRIMSRMGFCTPDQVAAAIAFIGSDESAYTTGAVLSVDGGLTA